MIATLVLFDNAELSADPAALRARMHGRAEAYRGIPGLLWKIWLDEPGSPHFGALLVWESRAALDAYRAGSTNSGLGEFWASEPVVREFVVNQVLQPDGTVTVPPVRSSSEDEGEGEDE